jgi:DNA-binding Lrp family transcriptional regulator
MSGETFKRGGRYSIVPAVALYSGKLTATDIHVLCAIGHHTDQAGWCHFNQRSLAEAIGVTRETANRCIKKLTEAGFLEHRDINRGKAGKRLNSIHRYRVLMDVQVEPAFDAEYDATSRCEDDITTQDVVSRGGNEADERPVFAHDRCDSRIKTVVTPGAQHNDLLRTTSQERKIADARKAPPPAAPAPSGGSKSKRGTVLMDFGSDADAQAAARKREMEVIAEEDRGDYDGFCKVAAEVGLDVPRALTSGRKQALQTIRKQYGPKAFGEALEKLRNSRFCHGHNARGWVLRLDDFLKPELFVKVLEGAYINRAVVPLPTTEAVDRAEWEARMDMHMRRKKDFWGQTWGPKPGEPGCDAPVDLLQRYGFSAAA